MSITLEREQLKKVIEGITLERIQSKEITVGVIGLGYVGLPLSLVYAEQNISVIGFDVDESKIETINAGRSYFQHISEEKIKSFADKKVLQATSNFEEIANCDAVILCVPTPLSNHWEPDLKYIRVTCEKIAPYIKKGALISLESTTWPGTTEEVVLPLIEKLGNKRVGKDFYLCYSPEREDPGNISFGTKSIPKLVGGYDDKSLELAVALYEVAVDEVIPLTSTKVAEAAKLFENVFRGVNIALVNELKVILDKMDINVWEVIQAADTKPFGFMAFWPGPGLGGHCIPIDPFYLTWKAKEYGVNTRFIELAGEINRGMPNWVVNKVQDCLNEYSKSVNGSKVLILGLAYKPDVDDMRESPSLELIKLLEEKGATVEYHDPFITKVKPNREYKNLIGKESKELSRDYDCFVVATKHSCFDAKEILSFGVPIVDTRNLLPKHELVYLA